MSTGVLKDALIRGWALAGLLVLVLAAGFVLDYLQVASPELGGKLPLNEPCTSRGNAWFSRFDWTEFNCTWSKDSQRILKADLNANGTLETLQLTEQADRSIRVVWSVELPASDPLIARIRNGDAAEDPHGFAEAFVGTSLSELPTYWSAPTLTSASGDDQVEVTSVADIPPPGADTLQMPIISAAITVSLRRLHIVLVQGELRDAQQSATHLAGVAPDAILLGIQDPSKAVHPDPTSQDTKVTPVSMARKVADQVEPTALELLQGTAFWVFLWLAGRWGRYGQLAQHPAWMRFLRLTQILLAAHLVVVIEVAAISLDYTFESAAFPLARWPDDHRYWPTRGLGIPGGALLLTAAVLGPLPFALRRWRRDGHQLSRPSSSPWRRRLAWPTAAASGAAAIAWTVALGPRPSDWEPAPVLRPLTELYGGTLLALALLTLLARPLVRLLLRPTGGGQPAVSVVSSLGWTAAIAVPLMLMGELVGNHYGGVIPRALRWVSIILPGTVAALCLVLIAWTLLQLGRQPTGGTAQPPQSTSRLAWILLLPLAVAATVPIHIRYADVSSHWPILAQSLDGLSALLLMAAAVMALRSLGGSAVTAMPQLRAHRAAAMPLAAIAFTGSYSFYRAPSLWSLLVAALGVWWLFPAGQVDRAADVLRQTDRHRRRSVDRSVEAGTARRQLSATRGGLRAKIATDNLNWRTQLQTVRSIERAAATDQPLPGTVATSLKQYAFGSFLSRRPWRRACRGAAIGAVAGAPWTVLNLAGAATLDSQDPYPWIDLPAQLAQPLLHWVAYGFVFGYFFPLVRGTTGLSKGLSLFTAGTAPLLLDSALLPDAAPLWSSTVVGLLQFFAFGLTLGLWCDHLTLAHYRYHWTRLADVHNLGAVAAWISSVLAAVATGLAALLLVGAQPFITGLIQPPTVPSPAPEQGASQGP